MRERIDWLRSRIKQFTQFKPSLSGDVEYKKYLFRCVKLKDIDDMLTSLEESRDIPDMEKKMILGQLEKELNRVLKN
ncbi:MAG: hypothetical protein IKG42_05450 [Clostridia bacterium]|nr:hypothetical protein [Clostridia bacterium]